MRNRSSRRFILRLLLTTGYFNSTFDGDVSKSFFNQGRREIGIWLMSELQSAVPDELAAMLKEHFEDA